MSLFSHPPRCAVLSLFSFLFLSDVCIYIHTLARGKERVRSHTPHHTRTRFLSLERMCVCVWCGVWECFAAAPPRVCCARVCVFSSSESNRSEEEKTTHTHIHTNTQRVRTSKLAAARRESTPFLYLYIYIYIYIYVYGRSAKKKMT